MNRHSKKTDAVKNNLRLWFKFSLLIMAVLLVIMLLMGGIVGWLYKSGLLSHKDIFGAPLLIVAFLSAILGTAVALFVGSKILKPVIDLSHALKKVAHGDFSVRLHTQTRIKEITDMCENFNEMAKELSTVETLGTDFVVNVSHEFKTPIAAIEGYATLLQNHQLSTKQHDEYIEKLIDNTRRLSTLTSNILRLSKLENQERITDKSEFLLDEQIRKVVLMLEYEWTAKNINLDIDLEDCMYFGNEGLLHQVWYNLLGNAIKFSNDTGTIRINLRKADEYVTVQIADTGCGIETEKQKHIFEKFYQGDKTRSSEGNGLGLALVKRIVDLSNGQISAVSEVDKGSVFTVKLPIECCDGDIH